MYLAELTKVVNRTGDPATLEKEARRIGRDRGVPTEAVLGDLRLMRRTVVAEAVRANPLVKS